MTEIGGDFHFLFAYLFKSTLNQFDRFVSSSARYYLTASGRDSLKLIINLLGLSPNDEVLLPSYLCAEVLRPFQEEKIKFTFYKINKDLSADISDIEQRISKGTKALLIIHYFGYPQPIEELKKLTQKHSVLLIEDTAQAFLTKYKGKFLGGFGDIAFTSFRKFLPVMDGSLLLINKEGIMNNLQNGRFKKLSLNYISYISLRCLGMSLKSLYLKVGLVPKPLFLWLFATADKTLNEYPKPAQISALSRSLLNKFDFDDISSKRRGNFQYLLDNWHFDSLQLLFQELPDSVCPLGFPVLANDREYVKRELIKRRIYPPIHWNLPVEIDKDEFGVSWDISRRILTIPIDQRYGNSEMVYILKQIEELGAKQQ